MDRTAPAHRRDGLQPQKQVSESQLNLNLGWLLHPDRNGVVSNRRVAAWRCRSFDHEADLRTVRSLSCRDAANSVGGRCRRATQPEHQLAPAKSGFRQVHQTSRLERGELSQNPVFRERRYGAV
jgi:hypothetical protein